MRQQEAASRSADGYLKKHELIAAALRREILSGAVPRGAKLASEGGLCARFKSSRGPIRQALAALEREALIYRVKGSGSFVAEPSDHAGHSDRKLRVKVILGFGADSRMGVGAELIEALTHAGEELGNRARLSFEFGFGDCERFLKASPTQVQAECDGLLVLPITSEDMEMAGRMAARRLPMVVCFRRLEEANVSQVYVDQDEGAFRATEYLLRYGHRRIGLLTALDEKGGPRYDSQHRLRGLRAAFERANASVDESLLVQSTWAMDVAVRTVTELLRRADRPSALMVGGLMLLPPVLIAIQRLGLRVPEDLSLLAFDDSAQARFYSPPITVVNQCVARAARTAIRLLLDQITYGETQATRVAVNPELVVRDSCRPLA